MNLSLYQIRVLRYSFGVVLAMAITQAYGWFMAFLVPVLLLSFLNPPAPDFKLRDALKFIGAIALACIAGYYLSKLVSYPVVYTLILFLCFVLLFSAREKVIPKGLKTWLLIAILLIPTLTISSKNISLLIAMMLFVGALVTCAIAMFMYKVFPNPSSAEEKLEAAEEAKEEKNARERFFEALESSIVILPVVLLFNLYQWTGAMITLVFIAILSSMPAFAKSWKVGKFLLLGNLLGGIVSIIYYQIMTFVPEFYYMLLIAFILALIFGQLIMSGKPIGQLFASGFSTVLVIVGSVFLSEGDAGGKVWTRIVQIMMAVTYVVLAFSFIDRWKVYLKERKA